MVLVGAGIAAASLLLPSEGGYELIPDHETDQHSYHDVVEAT